MIERLDFLFPCAHGCEFSAAKKKLEEHEKECEKRIVPCPDGRCKEFIRLDTLQEHLNATKKRQRLENRDDVFSKLWTLPDDRLQDYFSVTWHAVICNYGDNTFFAKLAKDGNMFHLWLYVAAGTKVAKKYQVNFMVANSTTSLAFTGNVFPIDVKEADVIIGEQDIMSFGKSYLKKIEGDQNWSINIDFKIWEL
jgi:hypothetical protein